MSSLTMRILLSEGVVSATSVSKYSNFLRFMTVYCLCLGMTPLCILQTFQSDKIVAIETK